MKKKLITIACAILAFVLLIPIPVKLRDGGTMEYTAILYKISDVHAIATKEDMEKGKEYYEGIIVEVLGNVVYNSVK